MTYQSDPFGMLLVGRSRVKRSKLYMFGYQGSLQDNEIYGMGNSYTTFYRDLDNRLGRWWSIDPKTSKRPWESPYLSMGDNPICRVDPNGDEWYDKNTKRIARQTKRDFKEIKKNPNSTLEQKNEMSMALSELKAMKRSDQKFRISIETVAPSGGYTTMSIIGSDNVIDVVVPFTGVSNATPNGYSLRTMAHELHHGFQFIAGRISYSGTITFTNTINGVTFTSRATGLLYDVEDEVDAMKRGFAVEPGWTGWPFTWSGSITDQLLSAGSPSYNRLSMVERNSRHRMDRIDILNQREGRPALNLTRAQRLMDYETYQMTQTTPEIYVPQSEWSRLYK